MNFLFWNHYRSFLLSKLLSLLFSQSKSLPMFCSYQTIANVFLLSKPLPILFSCHKEKNWKWFWRDENICNYFQETFLSYFSVNFARCDPLQIFPGICRFLLLQILCYVSHLFPFFTINMKHFRITNYISISCRPVGWGCKIRRLHLCRDLRLPLNECPAYDTKSSDSMWSALYCHYCQVCSDPEW